MFQLSGSPGFWVTTSDREVMFVEETCVSSPSPDRLPTLPTVSQAPRPTRARPAMQMRSLRRRSVPVIAIIQPWSIRPGRSGNPELRGTNRTADAGPQQMQKAPARSILADAVHYRNK